MDSAYLDRLVLEFAAVRNSGAVEAQLIKIMSKLDKLYWFEAERLLTNAAIHNPNRLIFDNKTRTLLDLGILDWRLVEGGQKNRVELLRELYSPSAPNHYYFSEWLAHRYQSFILMCHVGGGMDEKNVETKTFTQARLKLYVELQPLFRNLPGFSPQAIEHFTSCRLDETLDHLGRLLTKKADPLLAEKRIQLKEIRDRMIGRARERVRSDEDLKHFDGLVRLDQMMTEKIGSISGPRPSASHHPTTEERIDFVKGELKLVRSLLRLGVAGSGLTKTHSVFISMEKRITKADVASVFSLVKEVDADLPESPAIAIAPFVGTGFYEWDRDTIFVPLRSTRSEEDSMVRALANFRILLDSLQEGGSLKRAYQEKCGDGDFRTQFIKDYRDWILGIGNGFRGGLSPEAYDFFRENVGPRSSTLFAPKEMVAFTPEERLETIQECQNKVNRAEAGFTERYRLAIAYFRERRPKEAFEQLSEAVRLNPIDGRALFSRGWLAAHLGATRQARREFEEVKEICPNSIWAVYALDELQKL